VAIAQMTLILSNSCSLRTAKAVVSTYQRLFSPVLFTASLHGVRTASRLSDGWCSGT
jgi:hypothetical protein